MFFSNVVPSCGAIPVRVGVDPHQDLIPTLMFSLLPEQCGLCSYAECRARVMIVVAVLS